MLKGWLVTEKSSAILGKKKLGTRKSASFKVKWPLIITEK